MSLIFKVTDAAPQQSQQVKGNDFLSASPRLKSEKQRLQSGTRSVQLVASCLLTFLVLLRPCSLSGVHGPSQVFPLQVSHARFHSLLKERRSNDELDALL